MGFNNNDPIKAGPIPFKSVSPSSEPRFYIAFSPRPGVFEALVRRVDGLERKCWDSLKEARAHAQDYRLFTKVDCIVELDPMGWSTVHTLHGYALEQEDYPDAGSW